MAIAGLHEGDPHRVAGFRLLGRIGSGGMGVVFLGQRAKEYAAVKIIRPDLMSSTEFRVRFIREVEIAQRINAPCVARVIDADPRGAVPYVAHEYVPGPSLTDYVGRRGPLSTEQLDTFAKGICEALLVIHEAGVIHRDLTPNNVLLSERGPIVVDFGIARTYDSTALTSTGAAIGTPAWMSPEQLRGSAVGQATDVWGWGSLVCFAGTGRPPFGGERPEAVMYRIFNEQPDLAGLPLQLGKLVAFALSRQEALRPTAAQLAEALFGTTDVAAADQQTRQLLSVTWVLPPDELQPRELRDTVASSDARALGRWRRMRVDHKAGVLLGLVALLIAVALGGFGLAVRLGETDRDTPPVGSVTSRSTARPTIQPTEFDNTAETSPLTTPSASSSDEPRFDASIGGCVPYPPSALDGVFQVSAPRGSAPGENARPYVSIGEVVQVGIRDKNGTPGELANATDVQARVIAPDGSSTTAQGIVFADEWLDFTYPNDFPGAQKFYEAGVYTVMWTEPTSGGFLACDGFWAG